MQTLQHEIYMQQDDGFSQLPEIDRKVGALTLVTKALWSKRREVYLSISGS